MEYNASLLTNITAYHQLHSFRFALCKPYIAFEMLDFCWNFADPFQVIFRLTDFLPVVFCFFYLLYTWNNVSILPTILAAVCDEATVRRIWEIGPVKVMLLGSSYIIWADEE